MINSSILLEKDTLDDGGINLFSKFINIDKESITDDIVIDWIRVDSVIEMRLDVLVKHQYGSYDDLDLVKKFNHMLNMFDLKEGDVIALPDLTKLKELIEYEDIKIVTIERDYTTSNSYVSSGSSPAVSSDTTSTTITKNNGVIKF